MTASEKVFGFDAVRARFLAGMRASRLHHAWLLHGAGGIGKATLAEGLAAAYLCERNRHGEAQEPCGSCHACSMLAAGSHPDFRHIARLEDKRDISIAQIRELLSFLSLSGAEGNRRVVLLDEAETMNVQAANALLKGLEEPSGGSLLLIVCSDLNRIPVTVRSRCMLEHCSPLNAQQTRAVLEKIGVQSDHMELAERIAAGRPGAVEALADAEVAAALEKLCGLTSDLARADVGAVQEWISAHIANLPHELVADVLFRQLEPKLSAPAADFDAADALHRAARNLAEWPARVVRQSLRPGPSLMAHLLHLRVVLRAQS